MDRLKACKKTNNVLLSLAHGEQLETRHNKPLRINIQNLVDKTNSKAWYRLSGGHYDKDCATNGYEI